MTKKHLRELFELTHWTMKTNLAGVSHEDSLTTPDLGGNCINWVLGHILVSRVQLLALLGHELEWDVAASARYVRGSPPIAPGEAVESLERLHEVLDASQEILLTALAPEQPGAAEDGGGGAAARGGDSGTRTAEPGPGESEEEELIAKVSRFNFHEAYHAGQIGLLRRILGKEGAIP